jgi:hypothetical protein
VSHDKIKQAARERMAETGEPYTTARREAIEAHQSGQRDASQSADVLAELRRAATELDQLAGQLPEAQRVIEETAREASGIAEDVQPEKLLADLGRAAGQLELLAGQLPGLHRVMAETERAVREREVASA